MNCPNKYYAQVHPEVEDAKDLGPGIKNYISSQVQSSYYYDMAYLAKARTMTPKKLVT